MGNKESTILYDFIMPISDKSVGNFLNNDLLWKSFPRSYAGPLIYIGSLVGILPAKIWSVIRFVELLPLLGSPGDSYNRL